MAGNPVPFPDIRPSKRTFTHGEYPTEIFRAQNGASVAVRYGNRPTDCRLQLQFQNISDEMANEILKHYEKINGNWNYVDFVDAGDNGAKSMEAGVKTYGMKTRLRGTNEGTEVRYRYASPPTVDFVFLDRCTVTCEFIGYLDGGLD